jgi:ribosomal protein S18 acetylase RimI-like enzyme
MDYTITPATLGDVPALNKLVNSAYRGDESRKGWASEADLLDGTRIDEAALRDMLREPGVTVLAYKEKGELHGCVELRHVGDKLYLGMLSVKPGLQGKGIGKKLMRAGEEFASAQACVKIFMTVISVRQSLIEWYVRHGYRLTGERKPFVVPDERWGIPKQPLEFVVLEKAILV